MASVIDSLRREHQNIAKLLDAFEHQINVVVDAAAPDYELLRGIADYFSDYPDRCHHPKENIIYERMRACYPEAAAAIGDLGEEHLETRARAMRFQENIVALFRDAVMPRDRLVSAGRHFIEAERLHMRMEEDRFFPIAEQMLTDEDWQDIASQIKSERDPIFDERVEARFKTLRDHLLAWEQADKSR